MDSCSSPEYVAVDATPDPGRPVLSIRQGEFGYEGYTVVSLQHLDLSPGEKVAIVGRSGCGKTTLLSAIAGMHEPLGGQVLIDGVVRDAQWRTRHTALTMQSFPLFHWLTVRQNLELACRIRRVKGDHVPRILEQFSALHVANRYPKLLSGGERCRASIAQAVVSNPKLLLLDEPFTGLDNLVKDDVAASLLDFARSNRVGLVLVTHELNDAIKYADRIIVLGGHPVTRVVAEVQASSPGALATVYEQLRRFA